jgi:hypothetical protein
LSADAPDVLGRKRGHCRKIAIRFSQESDLQFLRQLDLVVGKAEAQDETLGRLRKQRHRRGVHSAQMISDATTIAQPQADATWDELIERNPGGTDERDPPAEQLGEQIGTQARRRAGQSCDESGEIVVDAGQHGGSLKWRSDLMAHAHGGPPESARHDVSGNAR